MNITEYLTAEQDKWHRRYNDAEIEIDRLKRENEQYKLAIHRLIMERDCAIKDIKLMYKEGECAICPHDEETCMVYDVECEWRGVKYR